MGLSGDKEITYRIIVDDSGAVKKFQQLGDASEQTARQVKNSESAFSRLQAGIITLNQSLDLAQRAFAAISRAAGSIFEGIKQGSAIDDVNASFEKLVETSGQVADVFLGELQRATAGTISNFKLQQTAIESLRAGVKPDEFIELTKAARALSEQAGTDLVQELDGLSKAFETGRVRGLQNKLGTIELTAALDQLAKSLGVSTTAITEEQKVLLARGLLIDASRKKTAELGEIALDTGDKVEGLSVQFQNARDQLLISLATNEVYNESLNDLASRLAEIDFGKLIEGIVTVTGAIVQATIKVYDFIGAIGDLAISALGSPAVSQFNDRIDETRKLLEQGTPAAIKKAALEFDKLNGVIQSLPATLQNELIPNLGNLQKQILLAAGKTEEQIDAFRGLNKEATKTSTVNEKLAKSFSTVNEFVENFKNNMSEADKAAIKAADAIGKDDEAVKKLEDSQKKLNQALLQTLGITPDFNQDILDAARNMQEGGVSAEDMAAELQKMGQAALAGGQDIDEITASLSIFGNELQETQKKSDEFSQGIANAFGSAIQGIGSALAGGGDLKGALGGLTSSLGGIFGKEVLGDAIGEGIGSLLGGSFGSFGGPIGAAVGSSVGGAIFEGISGFFDHEPSEGTKAKNSVNEYFDQFLIDLDFGDGLAGTFDDAFLALDETAQQGFAGVGLAFDQLVGISEEKFGLVAAALTNTVGASLNDLQLLVAKTGVSAEQMSEQIVNAFLDGKVSFLEAQTALLGVQRVFEKGIPDGVGLADQAFQNFIDAGVKGGLTSVDALKDIGAEAEELGLNTLQGVQDFLLQSGRFSTEQIGHFFEELSQQGVQTVDQLSNLSNEAAISIGSALQAENFDFAEVSANIDELLDKVNAIPERVESSITFNVRSNVDSNTQSLISSGVNLGDISRGVGFAS